jgi:hypothetical protein
VHFMKQDTERVTLFIFSGFFLCVFSPVKCTVDKSWMTITFCNLTNPFLLKKNSCSLTNLFKNAVISVRVVLHYSIAVGPTRTTWFTASFTTALAVSVSSDICTVTVHRRKSSWYGISWLMKGRRLSRTVFLKKKVFGLMFGMLNLRLCE